MIVVGGQVALDEAGRVAGAGDVETQTRIALERLRSVLRDAGVSLRDVVRLNTYYVHDGGDDTGRDYVERFRRTRSEFFEEPGPCVADVQVRGLGHPDLLIQVEAFAAAHGVDREPLSPDGHWDKRSRQPFSHGWRVGDLVLVGGQIAADERGHALGVGDIVTQTRAVMENVRRVVEEAGADYQDVVKRNTYYVHHGEGAALTEYWEKMTKIRMENVESPGPCGTGVRVAGLEDPDLLIEIEAVAAMPGTERQPLMPQRHWNWTIPIPASQGWRVGDIIFVGGQVSADDRGRAVGVRDFGLQARRTFSSIRAVLADAGATLDDVVKLNGYFVGSREAATAPDLWTRSVSELGVCSTAVELPGLAYPDLLLEIDALAVRRH